MLVKVCKTRKDLDNPIVQKWTSNVQGKDGKVIIDGIAYPFAFYFWVNGGEEVDFIQEN